MIEADATQMRQVAMNLIVNAAEAVGPDGGQVAIATGVESLARRRIGMMRMGNDVEPGDYAFLEVRDNGAGMDARALQRMFEPFFTTKTSGSGLGLAAVQGIVLGHGGALDVTSKVGVGTCVRVWFPVAAAGRADPVGPVAAAGVADLEPQSSQNPVILLAMSSEFAAIFREAAANMTAVADSAYLQSIGRAVEVLQEAFASGHKLLVFGNGGSSADAQHFSAELVGRFTVDRRPLPAIALTTNQAVLTAWSNDHSFEDVFARQVEALGTPGDVAMAISTSGRSPNVLKALSRARERGLRTIGLTGRDDAAMAPLCDVLLAVPLTVTERIQEVHLVTYHVLCAALESRLFGGRS